MITGVEMIINNLRHRGATADDLVSEISFRQENGTADNEKFFGYSTEELQAALVYWDEC